jgi:parallel beta-helix repeat protein
MKYLFNLFFFFIAQTSLFATDYYVANNGNDANNGTAAVTPFQSIDKVNTLNLLPADKVLFRRGDVFRGQLNLLKSGNAANPILLDAYGTGANPVISGSVMVTGWSSMLDNVWQATCNECGDVVTGVYKGSRALPLGRFPNVDAPNGGYNTIQSHVGKTQITSLQSLPSNLIGAEIVAKNVQWILDRSKITTQTGNVVKFASMDYEPQNNWGFFIQNHPKTLDQEGEWYYEPTTKKFSIYSTQGAPSNIEATVFNKGINITGKFITIQNLQIEKTLRYGIYTSNVSDLTLKKVKIQQMGEDGLQMDGIGNNILLENDTFMHVNNNGILINNTSNVTIRGNVIKYIGLHPGRGKGGDGQYFALQYTTYNDEIEGYSTIENNILDSLGYVGIDFRTSNITVQNNIVSNYDLIKDDGGGIYTYNGETVPKNFKNQHVLSNIVFNAIGNLDGVYNGYAGAVGIYMDDCSLNVEIRDNTVFNCSGWGLVLHTTSDVEVRNNTIFNNGGPYTGGQQNTSLSNCGQNHDNILKNNIFFSKFPFQKILEEHHQTFDLSTYGTFDSNYYCRPFDQGLTFNFNRNYEQNEDISMSQWQNFSGKDPNSKKSPLQYKPFIVNNLLGNNMINNSGFSTNSNGWGEYSDSNNSLLNWSNNTALDGGCMKLSFSSMTSTNPFSSLNAFHFGNIFSVQKDKVYVLRFDAVAATENKVLRTFILQNISPYHYLTSPIKGVEVGTTKQSYEVLLSCVEDDVVGARLQFKMFESDQTIWIDNIELHEANVSLSNPDDSIRFEYNPTFQTKTVALTDDYMDVKGQLYSGNVTLSPFSSLILLRLPTTSSILSPLLKSMNFAIYPNPSDDFATVSYQLKAQNRVQITVFDSLGKVVLQPLTELRNAGEHQIKLNTNGWSSGVYFVEMRVGSEKVVEKLIVK